MGKWTVTEDTLTYTFEYTNGFKRTIRKSQIAIATLPNGQTRYSSSQSPFIQLADTSVSITSYTAGTSTIDFTNNGGDDWTIEFYITPTSVQLPTGYSIVDFFAVVKFWSSGVDTTTAYTNQTTDLTVNQSGLGAGVYQMSQIFSVSNGVDTKSFVIGKLVKVDGVGGIIAKIDIEGITINSINGLTINATVHINQVGCSYPIQWDALDNTYASISVLGNNITQTMVLPTSTTSLGVYPILDSVFTNDFTGRVGALSTITIQ